MNAIFKSKSTRLLSAFLGVLMVVAMLPVTAFAWTAEEGTKCTSTYGDLYLGSDGNNYYSKAGNTLFYNDDGSFYVSYHNGGVARYKYLMIDSNGTSHHVYCIESGVSYNYSDTYTGTSGKGNRYFQNLPVTAQYGIMMALVYAGITGWLLLLPERMWMTLSTRHSASFGNTSSRSEQVPRALRLRMALMQICSTPR